MGTIPEDLINLDTEDDDELLELELDHPWYDKLLTVINGMPCYVFVTLEMYCPVSAEAQVFL